VQNPSKWILFVAAYRAGFVTRHVRYRGASVVVWGSMKQVCRQVLLVDRKGGILPSKVGSSRNRILSQSINWLLHWPYNTATWYSGGSGFRSRPRDRPSWLRSFSWFPSVTPGECRASNLKLGHDRFLPNYFQLIIHFSPFRTTLHSLS
jgi:hypothetical protein